MTLMAAAWATRLHGPTTKSLSRCQRRVRSLVAPHGGLVRRGRRGLGLGGPGGFGRPRGLGHRRLLGLGLFLAGSLEQLRIDDEANLHGSGEDLGGSRRNRCAEGLLQPFLKMAVGHTDRQLVALPPKARVAGKPQLVAITPLRPDAPDDRLLQRRHYLGFTVYHGIPRTMRLQRCLASSFQTLAKRKLWLPAPKGTKPISFFRPWSTPARSPAHGDSGSSFTAAVPARQLRGGSILLTLVAGSIWERRPRNSVSHRERS